MVSSALDDAGIAALKQETRSRFGPFVQNRINIDLDERDRRNRHLGRDVYHEAGDMGLLKYHIDEKHGGDGRSRLEWGVVLEELGYLCRDWAFVEFVAINVQFARMIFDSKRDDLIEAFARPLVNGRRLGALAMYEANDPFHWHSEAVQDGDEWVLNGKKEWVSGALHSDTLVLYVREKESNDLVCFLIEPTDPGVSVTETVGLGGRTFGIGTVHLQNVRLGNHRVLCGCDGLSHCARVYRDRRAQDAGFVVGSMQAVFEDMVDELGTRVRFQRPVTEYPNVQKELGEIWEMIECGRSLVYRSFTAPRRDPMFDMLGTLAKHYVSQKAVELGMRAQRLLGAEAYDMKRPYQRFLRDSIALLNAQGAQDMLMIQVGTRVTSELARKRLRKVSF